MTHRLPAAALAAALALSACASAGGRQPPTRAALLSESPVPPDRGCTIAALPADLPSADLLVDSAALARDAAALWRASGAPPGHALVALRFDVFGLNVRREVIEHRLPPALADSLQKLVFAHRRTVGKERREWGVRLRLDLDEQPELRVGRSQDCRARLAHGMDPRDTRLGAGSGWAPSAGFSNAGGVARVTVRVSLDPRGHVVDARVERASRSISEHQVLSYVRSLLFEPATQDGHPVSGETVVSFVTR